MGEVGRGAHRRVLLAGVLLAAATGCGGGGSGNDEASGGSDPDALPDLASEAELGITVESWALVDVTARADQWRLADAQVTTDAVFREGTDAETGAVPLTVRILLPPGYDATRSEPYPVLYLLHGGNGDATSWSLPPATGAGGEDGGDIVEVVAGQTAFEGLVVMPEGGRAGWYSNWSAETAGHFTPEWETFHIEQLIPWIDENFNTSGDAGGRAIAGVSMGGYGALRYAGRHANQFTAVGAFSGGTDIRPEGSRDMIDSSVAMLGASVAGHGVAPPPDLTQPAFELPAELDTADERLEAVFGPESSWVEVNPLDMAGGDAYLPYATRLGLYSGNTGDDAYMGEINDAFHVALTAGGVDHRYCRGPGSHEWQYWRVALVDFLNYVYGTAPSTCTTNPDWALVL